MGRGVRHIPGCASQGETLEELVRNLREAIEGCLSAEAPELETGDKERVIEIAI